MTLLVDRFTCPRTWRGYGTYFFELSELSPVSNRTRKDTNPHDLLGQAPLIFVAGALESDLPIFSEVRGDRRISNCLKKLESLEVNGCTTCDLS